MENEKYGIEFQAITDSFKAKMKELANYVRNFGKKAEEETTVMPKLAFGDYTKEIEKVQDELDALQDVINATKSGKIDGNVKDLQKEYDQLLFKLVNLKNAQKDYNQELEETNEEASGMSINLGKMFDNSIAKIKRFSFYLLGARSVFSLFMKYQGIYYQYNEQMQYQSELSQNAIALSLAPAFEFLGNVVAYASIAIAKFIELLTGVNVLSKVSTKGIRDYNKSLKETQTLVSGIDEITNLTMPSGTGLASQYKALEDFQKKIAEVERWFEENPWVQDVVKGIKTIWDWTGKVIDKIGGVENALILLGGTKVMTSLAKLLGSAGVAGVGGTGLLAIAAVLGAIYGYSAYKEKKESFVTETIDEDIKKLEEYKKLLEEGVDWNEYKSALKDIELYILPNIVQKAKENGEEYDDIEDSVNNVLTDLEKITDIDWGTKLKEQFEYDPKDDEGFFNGLKSGFKTMIEGFTESDYDKSWDKYKEKVNTTFNDIEENADEKLDNISNTMDETFKDRTTNVTFDVDAKTNKFETKISDTLRKYGFSIGGGGNLSFGGGGFVATPHAKGLDYVPYDNYPAMLHKGEAVVPAKYNPTIHSQGNEQTNALLETLIIKVDDLASRPNVFEIDGRQFANATYPLYEDERQRQNYVEGVVR
jgi:hypothetical protein